MVLRLMRHNDRRDALCHLLVPGQARSGVPRGTPPAGGKGTWGGWHQRRMERGSGEPRVSHHG